MSGGIDSSIAGVLLKKQGFDVVGVFMHFWKEPGQDALRENKCCSLESQEDARKTAQILNIPLYTANIAKEFKKEVVDYFLDEIRAEMTPNPCVVCNKRIKFNFLFKKMLELDADFVATGHYARIKKLKGKYHLCIPRDKEKDQTYFLYNLSQKEMGKIIFPLGIHKKSEIREMAKRLKLPVFEKGESQDICFIQEKNPGGFIKRNIKLSPGEIMLTDGSKIGMHDGLELYTIGQRRGINIGGRGPYYVVEKNFKNNQLVVTNDEKDRAIWKKSMDVEIKNWIAGEPDFPLKTKVKIRYRNPLVDASIKKKVTSGNRRAIIEVCFKEPQRAVTPGQSAVFYSGKGEILGGGIILR